MATLAVKRKETVPPDGYVCHLCNEPGHWIQQCPTKTTANKKPKKSSGHTPVAGVDPSQDDINAARVMQKIKPPHCFCGIPSRLKKVKRSTEGGEKSRAIGKYFFFCSKKKGDDTACRFARPVEDELKPKKERICTFWAKYGSCKKGDKCIFSHDAEAKGANNKQAGVSRKEKAKKEDRNIEDYAADKNEKLDEDGTSSRSNSSSVASSDSSAGDSSNSSDSDDDSTSSSSSSSSDDGRPSSSSTT